MQHDGFIKATSSMKIAAIIYLFCILHSMPAALLITASESPERQSAQNARGVMKTRYATVEHT